LGAEVAAFEKEFAEYCEVSHAVGAASGAEALQLALMACGVGENDEALIPAHTAVATVSAVEASGAIPILMDIDPARYTLDPNLLAQKITPRTRAVIPVHLYGCPVDMNPIVQFAREKKTIRCGRLFAGAWGDVAAFSFYPAKNLGAYGDGGGAVVTSDAALAEKARLLRQYGWKEHYISSIKGINSRLDELQAGILRVKLRHLNQWNARRIRLAGLYHDLLSGTELILPVQPKDSSHVFHQYVIRHSRRDELKEYLRGRGIHTLAHYPVPIHLQPAHENFGCMVGSLPIYPELPEGKIGLICRAIMDFLAGEK
jgi:dTDP-4-amino-4,6-dideoxygalactose transaminase